MRLIHNKHKDIDPDEIFLDSSNLSSLNKDQLEGRLEKSISGSTIIVFSAVFLIILGLFVWRVADLQVWSGSVYADLSENNRLDHTIIFSERGVISDRNQIPVVWNEFTDDLSGENISFPLRAYLSDSGLSHVLGYVSYPKTDSSGIFYQTEIEGKAGVEFSYDRELKGENGTKIIETDVHGNLLSGAVLDPPVDGKDLTLAIDSRIQKKLHQSIKSLSSDAGFVGGASVLIDVTNGELIALVSFPEFDSQVVTNGIDRDLISSYINSDKTPFLNRAIAGLYTPGSIVKPYIAIGALEEGVISPSKRIYSSGVLEVQNPYNPDEVSLHHDWKAHGWVDIRDAIAVSSNIYFFNIGGGFEEQSGIGISGIEKFTKAFGLDTKTGIDIGGEASGLIPTPEWKKDVFDGDTWRLGDTYNTSIGQYGFQVTPIAMARAVSSIANGGLIIEPHVVARGDASAVGRIEVSDDNIQIIREGMRQGVLSGTATGVNITGLKIAAKSGTAEIGISKKRVNSWLTGFFPYDNPRYAFATVMEKGPEENLVGATFVMRELFEWMKGNTPEYFE